MANSNNIRHFKSNPALTQQNLQIIACAGSGKTEFVSSRIAFLISEKTAKPENIVAFTFTERAAKELKFRIRRKIRELVGHQYDIGDIYVGTIHSFCCELLKEFVPKFRVFDVLDEGKRFAFISSLRKELHYHELKEWLLESEAKKPWGSTELAWVINTFIRSVDIAREEMLAPEKITAFELFPDSFYTYDEILLDRHFLDFSSMMSLAVKILNDDKDLLGQVQHRYTHITVDEYQDINPIQEKLIRLLSSKNINLCVVGDDDQSVYQWRGSTIENILTFTKRYKNVYGHHLPVNYRSTNKIIALSNQLVKINKKRLEKSMKHSGKVAEKGDIYKLKFEFQEDEADFIVIKINEIIGTEWINDDGTKRGLAYSDIAIFFRSVKYNSQPYVDALDNAEIPYAVSGIGGLFKAPEVDLIFSIFSYLGDFEKFWDSSSSTRMIPDEEVIYKTANHLFNIPRKKAFIKYLQDLKDEIKGKKRLLLQSVYFDILNLLSLRDEHHHDENDEIKMYNLGRLSEAISDYEDVRTYCTFRDIKRFCWYIKNFAENNYDYGAGEDPTRMINAVQIITLHGTKGLGFPVVFMPYCVDRQFRRSDPGFLDPDKFDFSRYHGSLEDERRLFYVGMTRSKKFLFITTSRDPGPRKRKKIPSRFFNELQDKYCILENIADPTRRKKLKSTPAIEDYQFPTSYSELSDYLRCEYDYKLRYIYGFNPGIVQALGYGRQVHNILNMLHKIAQQDDRYPTDEEAANLLKDHFYLRYASREQSDVFMRSALRSILRYMDMWNEDFTLSVKFERPFEMDVDNALLSGTIDLLKREKIKDNILEVIDFKTGNERKMTEELHLQVQLYTIAAREALGLNVDKAFVHFLDAKKQARVEILTTPKQLDLAMKTIQDSVNSITKRRFRMNPKNPKTCETCDWYQICPTKGK